MLRQRATPFDAIAHPVRRRILECLLDEPERSASITSVADHIEVSRSTASRHFAILRTSGLVLASKGGLNVTHTLQLGALASVGEWLWPFFDIETRAMTEHAGA